MKNILYLNDFEEMTIFTPGTRGKTCYEIHIVNGYDNPFDNIYMLNLDRAHNGYLNIELKRGDKSLGNIPTNIWKSETLKINKKFCKNFKKIVATAEKRRTSEADITDYVNKPIDGWNKW